MEATETKITVSTDTVVLTTGTIIPDNNRRSTFKELKVLLIKRDTAPSNGMWSLPGGRVPLDKGLADTAKSKLVSKTGITPGYMEQLYTYGDDITRDPRGRTISVAYIMLTRESEISYKHDNENKEMAWFWMRPLYNRDGTARSMILSKEIPEESTENPEVINYLAFDHMQILTDAFNRIRNKIEYTDIIFHAMEEKFTMLELQSVYERFKGEEIAGFRRKIGDMVIGTDEYSGGSHRPAQLFTYNPIHNQRF